MDSMYGLWVRCWWAYWRRYKELLEKYGDRVVVDARLMSGALYAFTDRCHERGNFGDCLVSFLGLWLEEVENHAKTPNR